MQEVYETIHNSINWIGFTDTSMILHEPLHFGNMIIEPGQILKKLGKKARTSFELQVPIRYIGKFINDTRTLTYILFKTEEKVQQQTSLFDKQITWFILFVRVNDDVLLMQTSDTGFYDIRA